MIRHKPIKGPKTRAIENRYNRLAAEEERLIEKIAGFLYKKYCPMGEAGILTLEDIYHWGVVGFMDARQKFDPSREVPFTAYAAIRVRGAIMDALRKAPQIRLPQEKQARIKRLDAARAQLENRGITPDSLQLMDELGWNEDQLLEADALRVSVGSADHNPRLYALAAGEAPAARDPEARMLDKDLGRIMEKCLDGLAHPMERMVLVARQLKGMKLRLLAEKCGCAVETVRQKELKARAAMKACLEKHGWHI